MSEDAKAASHSIPRNESRTVRRILRAFSVLCVAGAVGLIALWVRSYRHADRFQGRLSGANVYIVASKQGRVTVVAHGRPILWQSGLFTFPIDDEMSFPVGSVRQHESALGFGTITDPLYMLTRSTFETPEGATILISGAAVATLVGDGVIVPYWFLVLAAGLLAAALRLERPWRYTTRSLFIAVTFVAIVLGLAAGLDKRPDPWTLDIPAPLDEL